MDNMTKFWILAKVILKRDTINSFQLIKAVMLFILVIFNSLSFGQCPTCPTSPPCSGGNGALTNGSNVNTNTTFWYTGTGTLTTVNISGGTIIVCGDLTISSGNLNPGSTFHIRPGGILRLNIGNLNFNGEINVYNSGTLFVVGNVIMQNANNRIINCLPASNLTVTGNLSVLSATSSLTNYGSATISGNISFDGVGCRLCIGTGSEISVATITNNGLNSVCAPSGAGCIRYTGMATLNQIFTSSSNVNVCRATGSSTSGGGNFGSATVTLNCPSCTSALPIKLLDFTAVFINNESVKLDWQTVSEINNDYFTIEKSKNGYEFEELIKIDGAGESSTLLRYSTFDNDPYFGVSYYRLKQTDFDGKFEYFDVRSITNTTENDMKIFPNPATKEITITGKEIMLEDITIYNTFGQNVTELTQKTVENEGELLIDLSKLSSGIYYIKTKTTANKVYKQ